MPRRRSRWSCSSSMWYRRSTEPFPLAAKPGQSVIRLAPATQPTATHRSSPSTSPLSESSVVAPAAWGSIAGLGALNHPPTDRLAQLPTSPGGAHPGCALHSTAKGPLGGRGLAWQLSPLRVRASGVLPALNLCPLHRHDHLAPRNW